MSYDITYMWNLKYDTNELIYEAEIGSQTENRLVLTKGEGNGEGWIKGVGLADANYFI